MAAEKLAKLIGDLLQAHVDPNDHEALLVESYGAESMDIMELADMVEREFHVEVTNKDLPEIKSFGDVLRIVVRKTKPD